MNANQLDVVGNIRSTVLCHHATVKVCKYTYLMSAGSNQAAWSFFRDQVSLICHLDSVTMMPMLSSRVVES